MNYTEKPKSKNQKLALNFILKHNQIIKNKELKWAYFLFLKRKNFHRKK